MVLVVRAVHGMLTHKFVDERVLILTFLGKCMTVMVMHAVVVNEFALVRRYLES